MTIQDKTTGQFYYRDYNRFNQNQEKRILSGMFNDLLTGRLVLRRLVLSDSQAIYPYRSDPQVYRFQSWKPQTIEEAHLWVESLAKTAPNEPGTWFQLAITLRESGQLIGDCGLHFPADEPGQAEIGVTLAPAYQGKGYACEALTAVLDYLFLDLGKHRVHASVDPRNLSSIALLERLGMRREAHFRESIKDGDEWVDDLIYAILDQEWKSRSTTRRAS